MNLDQLFMEEEKIKAKIEGAIKTIIEWFEDKMKKVEEIFEEAKSKVTDSLKNKKIGTVKKDVKDKNGKIILKAGDSSNKIVSVLKSGLLDIKTKCGKVKENCKKGIFAAKSKNVKAASDKKEKVREILKGMANGIMILTVVISAVNGAKTGYETRYNLEKARKNFNDSIKAR